MIEVVATMGPGLMHVHVVCERHVAMQYVANLPSGYEIVMSPTDKPRGVYHG